MEQSLTETEESGKALSRVSTLPRTRPDMHEQSRSERPQPKQHARLILLQMDILAITVRLDERRGRAVVNGKVTHCKAAGRELKGFNTGLSSHEQS